MTVLVSENYSDVRDKIFDNLDFVLFVFSFSMFLCVFGVGFGFFISWIYGLVFVFISLVYFCFIFYKLRFVCEKISVTDLGIHSQRVFLKKMFKFSRSKGNCDEFYVVFSDVESFYFKGNTLKIHNKNSSVYDDLNYSFSNLSENSIFKIREILVKKGVFEKV